MACIILLSEKNSDLFLFSLFWRAGGDCLKFDSLDSRCFFFPLHNFAIALYFQCITFFWNDDSVSMNALQGFILINWQIRVILYVHEWIQNSFSFWCGSLCALKSIWPEKQCGRTTSGTVWCIWSACVVKSTERHACLQDLWSLLRSCY